MADRNRIQASLIKYILKFGSINLVLPDGVGVEIGITQETKHGEIKSADYCWVVTSRDDRRTMLDRHSMSMLFDDERLLVDSQESGTVYVL